jgi:nucleotide-binding universal stress UspA family protein
MIDITNILCPIDLSEYSHRALDHAVAIARWYDSSITVLHVYSATPVAAYAPGSPILESTALTPADREQLASHTARFVDAANVGEIPVEVLIVEGNVTAEILSRARNAGLLVIGTHGRSGFDRLVLGSVTEKVLRKAECPVLVVPRAAHETPPGRDAVFKRILCPIDFSEVSLNALNYAMSLAQEADAHLTVLHVMTYEMELTPEMSDSVSAYGHLSREEFRKACEDNSRERLKAVVPDTVRAYCTVETRLATGRSYREILHAATEQHADLIVMGVHGRGAADLMFFGSTTQHVVRQATCPVLTLRQPVRSAGADVLPPASR